MYSPPFNVVDDEDAVRAMVAASRSAWLVTAEPEQVPRATLLPVLWHGDTVVAHMARANPHWRGITDGMPGLLIASGPEAYVSPSWYASKAEHGRVVPTWNYSAVHLSGTVRVHDDPEWVRHAVTRLTQTHEAGREQPWAVDDAPEPFVAAQLRGIVGIELTVTGVEGKAKLSQNRSGADRAGVVDGLLADDLGPAHAAEAAAVADAMATDLPSPQPRQP